MKSKKSFPIRNLIKIKQTNQPTEQSTGVSQSESANREENCNKQIESSNAIFNQLDENLHFIKKTLGNSSDIVIRNFQTGDEDGNFFAIVYTDGLTDINLVQDYILETLMPLNKRSSYKNESSKSDDLFDILKKCLLPVAQLVETSDFQKLFHHLLSGDTILLIEDCPEALIIGTRKWSERGVQEPTTQTVVRGPKDGFSETLDTNISLIRRRIKDTSLWIVTKQIGTKTHTDVAIMYMNGIANNKIVREVHTRLESINVDSILEGGQIEELIQDETYSPFPTVFNSERPDVVAAALLEGRIAIIVDGTPFVLVVPALFTHFFQASEDYYQRADIATFVRLLRYLAFFLALMTPSAYIAVTTFHQEMLPSRLLISLAAQREGVPFPALVEAVIMEITFELLREAGVRMPRAVGSSISIVGALVIGQAAVEAGLVSATMVIVVSLTAICSFVSPTFNMSISARLLRFPLMLLAASFGLFGILIGIIIMILHLNSLRSFGIPYLSPTAPFILQDQGDNLIRVPNWFLKTRPRLISQSNEKRKNTPPPKQPTNSN